MAKTTSHEVWVLGKRVALHEVQEGARAIAEMLDAARRAEGYAECACVDSLPRPKLQIRRHGAAFLLARWPEQADLHATGCPFGREWGERSKSADQAGPFQVKDGALDVRLEVPLAVSGRSEPVSVARQPGSASGGTSRSSASLLAFLEFVWEAAALHRWPGNGHRSWNTCWSRLIAVLDGGTVNGQSMSAVVHVMRRWEPQHSDEIVAALDSFLAGIGTTGGPSRGILIGELQSLDRTQYGAAAVLRQSRRRYFLGAKELDRFQRSFGPAVQAVGEGASRCVAVLAVAPSGRGYWKVVDMAGMLTSAEFLPCDSRFEVSLVQRLVREGRVFEKPLRHVGAAPIHPDAVLLDTSPSTVVEVYGIEGSVDYDQRKQQKRKYLVANGIPFVEWHPGREPLSAVAMPIPS